MTKGARIYGSSPALNIDSRSSTVGCGVPQQWASPLEGRKPSQSPSSEKCSLRGGQGGRGRGRGAAPCQACLLGADGLQKLWNCSWLTSGCWLELIGSLFPMVPIVPDPSCFQRIRPSRQPQQPAPPLPALTSSNLHQPAPANTKPAVPVTARNPVPQGFACPVLL